MSCYGNKLRLSGSAIPCGRVGYIRVGWTNKMTLLWDSGKIGIDSGVGGEDDIQGVGRLIGIV